MHIEKTFHNDYYIATYTTSDTHEGMRLDNFALLYYPQISREQIKKKIKAKELIITNRHTANKPSTRLQSGDIIQITIHRTAHEDEYWNGKKLQLEKPIILFEDSNIIIISKPPFMATHPTGRHLFYCATVYFESRDKKTIHSVHRLDRETSGILILAKNPQTAQSITLHFEHSKVKKCYFFIAHRARPEEKINNDFSCNLRLGQTGEDLRSRVCVTAFPSDSPLGKHANTRFKILYHNTKYVLGLAFPRTGRQHQIRVHAAESGFPLLGDKIYHGGYEMFQHFKDGIATREEHEQMQLPRHALHATAISFPYEQSRKNIIAPIPYDLSSWIQLNIFSTKTEQQKFEQQLKDVIHEWFNELTTSK